MANRAGSVWIIKRAVPLITMMKPQFINTEKWDKGWLETWNYTLFLIDSGGYFCPYMVNNSWKVWCWQPPTVEDIFHKWSCSHTFLALAQKHRQACKYLYCCSDIYVDNRASRLPLRSPQQVLMSLLISNANQKWSDCDSLCSCLFFA